MEMLMRALFDFFFLKTHANLVSVCLFVFFNMRSNKIMKVNRIRDFVNALIIFTRIYDKYFWWNGTEWCMLNKMHDRANLRKKGPTTLPHRHHMFLQWPHDRKCRRSLWTVNQISTPHSLSTFNETEVN